MRPPREPLYVDTFRDLLQTIYHDGYRAGFHQGIGPCEFTLYRLRGEDKGIAAKTRRQIATHLEAKIEAEKLEMERRLGTPQSHGEGDKKA